MIALWKVGDVFYFRISLLLVLFQVVALPAQSYSKIESEENFRLGVNAFHFSLYQQAILFLEKSLSFLASSNNPQLSNQLQLWLGRAYYQNGDTYQALKNWSNLVDGGQASSALKAFYEIVHSRYSIPPEKKQERLALFNYLEPGPKQLFRRPLAVVQSPTDALRYLVDFADNSLLLLDINGKIVRKLKGALAATYHQPFDIIFSPEGGFIVSDYASNRLIFHQPNGGVSMVRGEEADLLGPQYLAATHDGYFYVSEWGHHRVVKWDFQGNAVFNFGDRVQDNFPGLVSPTGVAANSQAVFVADASNQAVYQFDHDGNYQLTLLERQLDAPEGLLLDQDNRLLIADRSRIKSYDFQSQRLRTLYQGDGKSKYYHLSYDQNGNLMASDFLNRRVELLISEPELYSNLFVSINRIHSERFPWVELDVEVESLSGRAVLDLVRENFTLFEENQAIPAVQLIDLSKQVNLGVIGGYPQLRGLLPLLEKQIGPKDSLQVVLDRNPLQVWDYRQFKNISPVRDPQAELSQALRMGCDALLNRSGKKILIYLSQEQQQEEFSRFGLTDMLQLLKNNNISLLVVGPYAPAEALRYLLEQTGGQFISTEQLNTVPAYLLQQQSLPSNVYRLRYSSPRMRTLQNLYLNSAVTVNYGQRSGRDESGYFPPS